MPWSITPGIYRRHDGRMCRVTDIALHSDTGQQLVICIDHEGYVWAHPLETFKGAVHTDEGTKDRFTFVSG